MSALLAGASPASASPALSEEQQIASATNSYRASQGVGRLAIDGGMSSVARAWSEHMAATGTLAHNSDAGAQVEQVSGPWYRLAENVGTGSTVAGIQDAFVSSPAHRANLLGRSYTRAGVGAARDSHGRLWVTVVFADGQPRTTLTPVSGSAGTSMTR